MPPKKKNRGKNKKKKSNRKNVPNSKPASDKQKDEAALAALTTPAPAVQPKIQEVEQTLQATTPTASSPTATTTATAPPAAAPVKVGAIGPAWTRGEQEQPAGREDMGGWTAACYTPEQQARLGVDKKGNKVDSVTAVTEATDDPTPDPSAATAAIPAANAGIENVGVKPDNRSSLSVVAASRNSVETLSALDVILAQSNTILSHSPQTRKEKGFDSSQPVTSPTNADSSQPASNKPTSPDGVSIHVSSTTPTSNAKPPRHPNGKPSDAAVLSALAQNNNGATSSTPLVSKPALASSPPPKKDSACCPGCSIS